jgi:hypothetical protein
MTAAMPPDERDLPDAIEGGRIVSASNIGTIVFLVATVIGTIDLDAVVVLVVVSLVLFAIGTAAFLVAYVKAIGRSRYEAIGMGGLFFLSGSAPRRVQVWLLGALALQVVVSLAAASVRIYTPVAFALLVPMYGLGLAGLWGATHGTFPPRQSDADVE